MAALAALPHTVRPIRVKTTFAARPIFAPNAANLARVACVHAAAKDSASGTEDDVPDLEVDQIQEERARKEDSRQAQRTYSRGGQRKKEEWEDKIVQLNRVTKVLKGGKSMKFRACVVSGNHKGKVGYGVASAKEVVDAVERASAIAKASAISVPMNAGRTFPHKIQIKEGASRVMLRPASEGTGVIAGGSVRVVLELAGYQNAFGKILGTPSAMNNARGTIAALSQMTTWKQVAEKRDVTIDFAMGLSSQPNELKVKK